MALPGRLKIATTQPPEGDVTLGPYLQLSDGSVPMVTKMSSGRMSPIRAKTMKEYDSEISELKKENFSLKLRIYFLEEKVQQKFSGDTEELFKTNIELKIDCENLRKQVEEKQDLLQQASNALETMSTQHKVELEHVREAAANQSTASEDGDELRQQVEQLQRELDCARQDTARTQSYLDGAKRQLADLVTANQQLQKVNRELEERADEAELGANSAEELAAKEAVIAQLRAALRSKDDVIEDAEQERAEAVRAAEREAAQWAEELQTQLDTARTEAKDQLDFIAKLKEQIQFAESQAKNNNATDTASFEDTCQRLQTVEDTLATTREELEAKVQMIGRLEDAIRAGDEEAREMTSQLTQLRDSVTSYEENAMKRDKAIQGLVSKLTAKSKEVDDAKDMLTKRSKENVDLKNKLHGCELDKYRQLEKQQEEMSDLSDTLKRQLAEKNMDVERLTRSLARQEQEVGRLTEALRASREEADKAEQAKQELLAHRRDHGKTSDIGAYYQAMLDDAQRQLDNQEKVLQRLTRSLKDRDERLAVLQRRRPAGGDTEVAAGEGVVIGNEVGALAHQLQEAQTELASRDADMEEARRKLMVLEEDANAMDAEHRQKLDRLTGVLSRTQGLLQGVTSERLQTPEQLSVWLTELRRALDPGCDPHSTITCSDVTPQRADTAVGADLPHQVDVQLSDLPDTQLLQQALRREQEIYSNLNTALQSGNTQSVAAVERELARVQSLRAQLQEGLSRSARRRTHLQERLSAGGDCDDGGDGVRLELENTKRQLEEAQRWNAQLQARLDEVPSHSRGGGVGMAKDDVTSIAAMTVPPQPADAATLRETLRQSNLAKFISPIEPTSPVRLMDPPSTTPRRHTDPHGIRGRALDPHATGHVGLPSFHSLPDPLAPDAHALTNMPAEELRHLVTALREDLAHAQTQARQLREQLDQVAQEDLAQRHIPGANQADSEAPDLRTQLARAQSLLQERQAQLDALSARLAATPPGGRTQEVERAEQELTSLRNKLREMKKINELLQEQIHLNTQSEHQPAGFNPKLIVQMAQEIERLRARAQEQASAHAQVEDEREHLRGELELLGEELARLREAQHVIDRETAEVDAASLKSGSETNMATENVKPTVRTRSQIPTLRRPKSSSSDESGPARTDRDAMGALQRHMEELRSELQDSKLSQHPMSLDDYEYKQDALRETERRLLQLKLRSTEALLSVGFPIMFMEMAVGQFASVGTISIWKVSPLFKGIGYAIVVVLMLVNTYYNVLIAYALFYLFASITSELPWANCDNKWNTRHCIADRAVMLNRTANATAMNVSSDVIRRELKTPTEEFFE